MRVDIYCQDQLDGSVYWHPGDQALRIEGPEADGIKNLLWGMRDIDMTMTDAELFYSLPQRLRGHPWATLIQEDDGSPLKDQTVAQGWIPSRFWPKEEGDPRPDQIPASKSSCTFSYVD